MFAPSSAALVPLLCLFFPWCSSVRTKTAAKPPPPSIDNVAVANFTKRPLNLYITANGKHVTVEDDKIAATVDVDKTSLNYSWAKPPFAIKTRGSLLVLTKNAETFFAGRPSLIQMLASSGHKTYIPKSAAFDDTATIALHKLVTQNNIEKFTLIADGSVENFVTKKFAPKFSSNLEALILVNFSHNAKLALKIPKIAVIELKASEPKETKVFPNSQAIVVDVRDAAQVMHVMQNFLDLLHVR